MLSKKKKIHVFLVLTVVLITTVLEYINQEPLSLNFSYLPITAEDKLALGCKLSLIDIDEFILTKIPTISGIRAEKIIKKIESLGKSYFNSKNYNNLEFFKSIHGIGEKTALTLNAYINFSNTNNNCRF
jgi:hypothetical protein